MESSFDLAVLWENYVGPLGSVSWSTRTPQQRIVVTPASMMQYARYTGDSTLPYTPAQSGRDWPRRRSLRTQHCDSPGQESRWSGGSNPCTPSSLPGGNTSTLEVLSLDKAVPNQTTWKAGSKQTGSLAIAFVRPKRPERMIARILLTVDWVLGHVHSSQHKLFIVWQLQMRVFRPVQKAT